MTVAGGFLGVVAGIYGIIAALLLLLEAHGDGIAIRIGAGGAVFSLFAILLGAVAIGERNRAAGWFLITAAICGMLWVGSWLTVAAFSGIEASGGYVPLAMLAALAGGVVAVL